jgi:hypothetical protein
MTQSLQYGSCARRGNNCQVFPDKLLRECEAALAIGGIEKKTQQEKFHDNGMRTFAAIYLVQTLLQDSLSSANASPGYVMMETECNRQIVSTRLIEKSKTYANRTGGTPL